MLIAVIGAGPCGLACAYGLLKRGHQVDIYEREQAVGGLSKSMPLWGRNVELGPHFLPARMDAQVKALLEELMNEDELLLYRRSSRIRIEGRLIDYPPGVPDLLRFWGLRRSGAAIFFFLHAFIRKKSAEPNDLESYIKTYLGSFIYRHFFKEYTEKLWRLSCASISSEYARSLIGLGDLRILSLLKKILPSVRKAKHSYCLYPEGGMSRLWSAAQSAIENRGGRFYFGAAVGSIGEDEGGGMALKAYGREERYDNIVSTIPEAKLLALLRDAPPCALMERARSLQSRNVLFIFLRIDRSGLMEHHTLYLHDRGVECVRITNCSRFGSECGNDVLLLEYWMDDRDELWLGDEECMIRRARKDLDVLLTNVEFLIMDTKIVRLPKAIPVPSLHNKRCRVEIGAYLNRYKNLLRTGRANQDQFNYGMEEALKDGLLCAGTLKE